MREQDSRSYPIREDMRFQRRSWAVERLSWVVLCLLVAVAVAGLFAGGPVSKTDATNGGATVEYERFQRETRLFPFTLRINETGAGPATWILNRAFHESYEIASIQPQPQASTGGSDGLQLSFARPASGELVVRIWAHPRRWGLIRAEARTSDGARVQLPILVYP